MGTKHKPTRSFWVMGVVGLLLNVATTCLFGVLPLFMRDSGVSVGVIAQMDAAIEMLSYASRVLVGALADSVPRKKPIFVVALLLLLVSQGGFLIFNGLAGVLVLRCIQRFSSGIAAVPRDVMVGALLPARYKARGFAIQRTLKVVGSVCGALGAAMFLKNGNYFSKSVLFAACFTGVAVLCFSLFFKETVVKTPASGKTSKNVWVRLRDLPQPFWALWGVSGLFHAVHFSETFLFFQAMVCGVPKAYAPLCQVVWNLGAAAMLYPIGLMGDWIGVKKALIVVFTVTMLSNFLFLSHSIPIFFLGVIFWGVQIYAAQSLFSALLTHLVPKRLLGMAFGTLYVTWGVALIVASNWAKLVFETWGDTAMFLGGALLSLLVLLLGWRYLPCEKSNGTEDV